MGVNGTDGGHRLDLTGANAEAVLITGGACTSGAASGTVTSTPANNHTAGVYGVASATGGGGGTAGHRVGNPQGPNKGVDDIFNQALASAATVALGAPPSTRSTAAGQGAR